MSSDAVVKSVGKKLRYYFEVKRLEEGFDLSGVNRPILDHPRLRPRKTLQCNVLKDVPLKHHFRSPSIRVRLTQFPGVDAPGSPRERKVKKALERYITRSQFVGVTICTTKDRKHTYNYSLSNYSYIQTSKGRKLRPEASGLCTHTRSKKRKDRTIKGAVPVIRSAPPHFVTKKQADRLVTVASKILVANETTEYKDRKANASNGTELQSAPAPFETKRQLPSVEMESRPKTSRGFHRKARNTDEGRDSAYTTDRTSPGSEEYHRCASRRSDESRSTKSSDSETEISPRPPAGGRPSNRRRTRPTSARNLHQNQIMDISHPSGGQVGIELGVQTRGTVAIQTDSRGELGDHIVRAGPAVDYHIYVRTGKRIGASTKAQVKLTLYGEHGRSQEFLLSDSQRHKIKFQKGHDDLFTIRSPHVGRLKCIKIGHDRPELMFAWFLEGVTVEDTEDKRVYECPCERWLSGQDGDKRTYRVLLVDRDRALLEDSEDDSGSDVSYIKKYGENTESERDDSPRNSPDSVRAGRSEASSKSNSSGSETDSETDTDSTSSVSTATPREVRIPVNPTNTDVKVTQTVQSQSKQDDSKMEVSPGRKQKDDFFDQRPAGPVYTFRTGTSVGSKEDADTEKPELSITESDSETSRTTTSDNTETHIAAVLPESTFPVIAEEEPKLHTTSATSQEKVTHEKDNVAPPPARIVPLIAVDPAVDTDQQRSTDLPMCGLIEEEESGDVEESSSEASTERRDTATGADNNKGATGDQLKQPLTLQRPTNTGTTADEPTETGSSTDRTTTTTKSGSGTDRATSKSGSGTNRTSTTTKSGSETNRSTTTGGSSTDRSTTEADTSTVGGKKEETAKAPADSGTEDSDSDSDSSGSGSSSGSDTGSDSEDETPRQQQQTEKTEKDKINSNRAKEAALYTSSGETLHEAAKSGKLEIVKQIVEPHPEKKSDLNEVGWTALHVAASEGQVEVVRWLGRNGDNLNTETPTGYSAIHLAALHGHGSTIMALSSLGATVNCQTTDHQTPLHLAALSGHLESVKWLIANGVDMEGKDLSGRTALDLAVENEHDDVEEYLRLYADNSHTQLSSSSTGHSGMQDFATREAGTKQQNNSKETSKPDAQKQNEEDIEEKRLQYEEQQNKMNKSGLSFLDSIRQELDS